VLTRAYPTIIFGLHFVHDICKAKALANHTFLRCAKKAFSLPALNYCFRFLD
jgi:hypothetical protein